MYEIKNGITFAWKKGRPLKYPLDKMMQGDFVDVTEPCNPENLRACAYSFGKRSGGKFAVRKTDNGYRIWRLA